MELVNKSILLISPEPWDHIFVSKHHYATTLTMRGNSVFFLGPPSNRYAINKTEYDNLWSLSYKGFPSGMRFFPAVLRRFFQSRVLSKLQLMVENKIDLIWSFDNSVFFDFNAFDSKIIKISHIVDLNQNFETKLAAQTATICFGVTQRIADRLKQYNPKTYVLSHGVKYSPEVPKTQTLPGKNKTKALYTGNLAMRHIDWGLVKALSEEFDQTVDFVFLGSNHKALDGSKKAETLSMPNVFLLDPVSANDIMTYLNAADILLVLYSKQYFEEYASPHKLLEYLLSGKIIISTCIKEYLNLEKDLIIMSKNSQQYIEKFSKVLENLDYYNNNNLSEKRKTIAFNNTYERKIDQVEKLIQNNG